jgi:hypothetical protein
MSGNTLVVPKSALAGYLAQGATLGACLIT